ncbi:hypothetical protein B0T18DRAFT_431137 [Schizothecium vesticola]|uniref:Uncharacterized protein n=1 Tax=Schizothecium vesticola TaxID=314040 RepID=A0AA40ER50_9PEZI|nr:hypothetical protein B0T18DRAFT_431137 [Schizothecium vesticola]
MSVPEAGNTLSIPAYTPKAEDATVELEWSQTFKTREATYYIVCAKNASKGNADVMLFVQDRFYKDESSPDYIGKIPGVTKNGDSFTVTINDRFQYGQKNKEGEKRWVVLHDKGNKMYQHRFMTTTVQGNAAEWAKTLANSFGAGDLASQVSDLGKRFVGDYLHTF